MADTSGREKEKKTARLLEGVKRRTTFGADFKSPLREKQGALLPHRRKKLYKVIGQAQR